MAAEFGREAFAILGWMRTQPELAGILKVNERRITAGAYRLSARYLLDGGLNAKALSHYLKSLWYHPATAWVERRRMAYATASLILPLGKAREKFVAERSLRIRSQNLHDYESLFDYGDQK